MATKAMAGFCIGICIGGGGDIPNGFIYSNSSGEHQTISYNSHQPTAPKYFPFDLESEPKRYIFLDRLGNLIGGSTQIDNDGRVYATARHVLAGQREIRVKDQSNRVLDLNRFYIFEVSIAGQKYPSDVLLLFDKEIESEKPDSDEITSILEKVATEPNINLKWYSWEFGLFDTKITDGRASGLLIERNESGSPYFWLDGGDSNYTAPGSSGSVVWQPQASNSTSLRPVGIVQCMEQPTREEKSVSSHTPKPRFLNLFYLASQPLQWMETNPISLLNGPRQVEEPNCKPIDGRQGGGF